VGSPLSDFGFFSPSFVSFPFNHRRFSDSARLIPRRPSRAQIGDPADADVFLVLVSVVAVVLWNKSGRWPALALLTKPVWGPGGLLSISLRIRKALFTDTPPYPPALRGLGPRCLVSVPGHVILEKSECGPTSALGTHFSFFHSRFFMGCRRAVSTSKALCPRYPLARRKRAAFF